MIGGYSRRCGRQNPPIDLLQLPNDKLSKDDLCSIKGSSFALSFFFLSVLFFFFCVRAILTKVIHESMITTADLTTGVHKEDGKGGGATSNVKEEASISTIAAAGAGASSSPLLSGKDNNDNDGGQRKKQAGEGEADNRSNGSMRGMKVKKEIVAEGEGGNKAGEGGEDDDEREEEVSRTLAGKSGPGEGNIRGQERGGDAVKLRTMAVPTLRYNVQVGHFFVGIFILSLELGVSSLGFGF